MGEETFWDNCTDEQHEIIIDCVDKLPSYFFGGYGDWLRLAKELARVIEEVERDE